MAKTQRDRLLRQLLKGKDPSAFDARALSWKAHWRWDRDQLLEAFVLFDAAARRADEDGDRTSAIASRNRAAVTLFRSDANRDEAIRRLRAVLAHYREHPKDLGDRHFVQWAWTSLCQDAARINRGKGFARAFTRAIDDCTALQEPDFPRITPHMELLAIAAQQAREPDIALALVAKRRARKPVPKAVRAQLDAIESWARR